MTDHACRGSSCGLAGSASQPVEYPYGLCDVSQGELDWLSPDWHEDLSATAVIAHESVTLPLPTGSCWIPGSYTPCTGRNHLISNGFFQRFHIGHDPRVKSVKTTYYAKIDLLRPWNPI